MDWLNYNHLFYFWIVAREGSIVRASEKLLISQPSISAQLKALETALKEALFHRVGRRLVLTEMGQTVAKYADDMFSVGQELMNSVKLRSTHRPPQLKVGVSDALPKPIIYRLLAPVLTMTQPVRLVVHEYGLDRLLIDLAGYRLDIVLSDAPVGREASVRTFSHLLGESGITFFARGPLARRLARDFPKSLNGAPMFLPTPDQAMRRSLNQWFEMRGIRPQVLGEFEDSSLLETFGHSSGVFPAPTVVEADVRSRYEVAVVGRAEGVVERFYLISIERKLKHPAVFAITEAAQQSLFSMDGTAKPKPWGRKRDAAHSH